MLSVAMRTIFQNIYLDSILRRAFFPEVRPSPQKNKKRFPPKKPKMCAGRRRAVIALLVKVGHSIRVER